MLLTRFSAPGNLTEMSPASMDAWHDRVSLLFDDVAALFPRLYNPATEDTPDDHRAHEVTWPAFPGPLLSGRSSQEARWKAADADRQVQDEYCEWSVLRDSDGDILRVTFTTETPEYYDHLFDKERELLLDLYEQAVGRPVPVDALRDNDRYVSANGFNTSTAGAIVHLAQGNNFLRAAVLLAGEATILRETALGEPVTHPQALVQCSGLGDPRRHSDPQIASAVNNLVSSGFDITLADPPGLYLAGLATTDMETPDGADAQEFWTAERGDPDHVVRARFEVPEERGYGVSDIIVGGRRIEFGAQLADRVQVRLTAIARMGELQEERRPCVN